MIWNTSWYPCPVINPSESDLGKWEEKGIRKFNFKLSIRMVQVLSAFRNHCWAQIWQIWKFRVGHKSKDGKIAKMVTCLKISTGASQSFTIVYYLNLIIDLYNGGVRGWLSWEDCVSHAKPGGLFGGKKFNTMAILLGWDKPSGTEHWCQKN